MTIIDGKSLAQQHSMLLKDYVESLSEKPGLAMILIGDNPASKVYVEQKRKKCLELGIHSEIISLPSETQMGDALSTIQSLNADRKIDGMILQLPLPSHLDSQILLRAISPEKDVDGLHPDNLGALFVGNPRFVPCTPQGCLQLIRSVCPEISGKRALVLGRSVLVGKPMAMLLLEANATVEIAHSRSKDIEGLCKEADIIVAATGRPRSINENHVRKGQVIIDVGITRVDGKLHGDVDFERVKDIVDFITPVPGGVGPMTVINLMLNTIRSFSMKHEVRLSEEVRRLLP